MIVTIHSKNMHILIRILLTYMKIKNDIIGIGDLNYL